MFFFWFEDNQQRPRRPKPPPEFKTAAMAESYHKGIDALYHGKPDTNPGTYAFTVGFFIVGIFYLFNIDKPASEILGGVFMIMMTFSLLGGLLSWLTLGSDRSMHYFFITAFMLWGAVHFAPDTDKANIVGENINETSINTSKETLEKMGLNENLMQSKDYTLCKKNILATLPDNYKNKFFNPLYNVKVDDKTRFTIYYNYINQYDEKIHRRTVCEIKDNTSKIVRTEFV